MLPPSFSGVLLTAATRRTPAAAGKSRKLCGDQLVLTNIEYLGVWLSDMSVMERTYPSRVYFLSFSNAVGELDCASATISGQ